MRPRFNSPFKVLRQSFTFLHLLIVFVLWPWCCISLNSICCCLLLLFSHMLSFISLPCCIFYPYMFWLLFMFVSRMHSSIFTASFGVYCHVSLMFQGFVHRLWHITGLQLPHLGKEMLTLSRTHDFTPFREFMISPIHYIYALHNLPVSGLYCMFTD